MTPKIDFSDIGMLRIFIHTCSKCGVHNRYKYTDYGGKLIFPKILHCYNCSTSDKCVEGAGYE